MAKLPSLFKPEEEQPKTVVQPEEKTSKEIIVDPNDVAVQLKSAVEKATANWPVMKEKSVAASAALSVFKKIDNDEDEAKAKSILGKANRTYKLIEGLRKETTSVLDEIKKKLMLPEKKISILAGDPTSEYNRVKNLLDGYANVKLQKQRAEQAEALRVENETLELSRLKGVFELLFNNKIIEYATQNELNVKAFFDGLQLEKTVGDKVVSWEEQTKRFNMTPKLKEDVFESWFNVDFDKTKLTQEKYDELIDQVKEIYTYEAINGVYVETVQPKVDEFKALLPEKKKELEDLAELEAKDKKAADKLKKKQLAEQQKANEKITAEAEKAKEDKAAEVSKNQQKEALSANFETMKVTQAQEDLGAKIRRIPLITCEPSETVSVLAQVLYHCFMHDDFEGTIKTDSDGNRLPDDEKGIPQYTDYVKKFLFFFADKCDPSIKVEGIDFKEIAVSSVRSSKKD